MDYGWLNIGSVILGLVAFILPILYIMGFKKSTSKYGGIVTLISLSACVISLCMQIFSIKYLINIGDSTAIMDTIDIVVTAAVLLLTSTIAFNIIAIVKYNKEQD